MKILGICGSIRTTSTNWTILESAQSFLGAHEWTTVRLDTLPYFDPDNQFSEAVPEVVQKMRESAASSDLIFISTPEYAHGVPGILKNGLEWLFCEGTQKKPVALVVASAQGEWALDQLKEILKTMDFVIADSHALLLKGARAKIKNGQIVDESLKATIEAFCKSLS